MNHDRGLKLCVSERSRNIYKHCLKSHGPRNIKKNKITKHIECITNLCNCMNRYRNSILQSTLNRPTLGNYL